MLGLSPETKPLRQEGQRMKHFKAVILVGLVTVFFVAGLAFAQDKAEQGAPKKSRCQARFDSLDTNKDGKVSKDEFLATPHPPGNAEKMFKTMDADGDGYLTKGEFCGRKGMARGAGKGAGQGQAKETTQ
jgi:hypothetical protein